MIAGCHRTKFLGSKALSGSMQLCYNLEVETLNSVRQYKHIVRDSVKGKSLRNHERGHLIAKNLP